MGGRKVPASRFDALLESATANGGKSDSATADIPPTPLQLTAASGAPLASPDAFGDDPVRLPLSTPGSLPLPTPGPPLATPDPFNESMHAGYPAHLPVGGPPPPPLP